MSEASSLDPAAMTPATASSSPGDPMDWKTTSTYVIHPSATAQVDTSIASSHSFNSDTEGGLSTSLKLIISHLTDDSSAPQPEHTAVRGQHNLAVSSISNGLVHQSTGTVISNFSTDAFPLPESFLELERCGHHIFGEAKSYEPDKFHQFRGYLFHAKVHRERARREKNAPKGPRLASGLVMMPPVDQNGNNRVDRALDAELKRSKKMEDNSQAMKAISSRLKELTEENRALLNKQDAPEAKASQEHHPEEITNTGKPEKQPADEVSDEQTAASGPKKYLEKFKPSLKPVIEDDTQSIESADQETIHTAQLLADPEATPGIKLKNDGENDMETAFDSDSSHTMTTGSHREETQLPTAAAEVGIPTTPEPSLGAVADQGPEEDTDGTAGVTSEVPAITIPEAGPDGALEAALDAALDAILDEPVTAVKNETLNVSFEQPSDNALCTSPHTALNVLADAALSSALQSSPGKVFETDPDVALDTPSAAVSDATPDASLDMAPNAALDAPIDIVTATDPITTSDAPTETASEAGHEDASNAGTKPACEESESVTSVELAARVFEPTPEIPIGAGLDTVLIAPVNAGSGVAPEVSPNNVSDDAPAASTNASQEMNPGTSNDDFELRPTQLAEQGGDAHATPKPLSEVEPTQVSDKSDNKADDTAQDSLQDTLEVVQQVAFDAMSQGVSRVASQTAVEDRLQNVSQDLPQNITLEVTSEDVTRDAAQDTSNDAPKDTLQDVDVDPHRDIAQVNAPVTHQIATRITDTQDTVQTTAQDATQVTTRDVAQATAQDVSQVTTQDSAQVTIQVAVEVTTNTALDASKDASRETSKSFPNDTKCTQGGVYQDPIQHGSQTAPHHVSPSASTASANAGHRKVPRPSPEQMDTLISQLHQFSDLAEKSPYLHIVPTSSQLSSPKMDNPEQQQGSSSSSANKHGTGVNIASQKVANNVKAAQDAADATAAQKKAAAKAEREAEARNAAAERAAAQKAAAAQRKADAAQRKTDAARRKADAKAAKKAAAERAAAERAATEKAAAEKAAAQRAANAIAAQKKADDEAAQRAAAERAATEKAAAEKAAAQRAAAEKAAAEKAADAMTAQKKAEAEAAQRAAVQKAADIEAARRAADAEAVQRSIDAVTAQRALVKSAAQRIVAERAADYNAAKHRAAQKAADDVAAQKAAEAVAAKKAADVAAAKKAADAVAAEKAAEAAATTAKKAAVAVAAKKAADALAAQNAAEFEVKNMDLSVIPWPLRAIQCTDAQMWQDLEWRATTHPILMAATTETLPKLVQDVYDALDQVLKISGLVGNRGVRGLPLPIQDTMTCVSWLTEMATQAAAPSVFKMGAYALMNLAIGLKAYAAAYTTFGNVSAAAAPPGFQPNHASLAFAVWYGPDGWRIQEAIFVAWDCWRVSRPMVQGSYGSWMWKDGSAWIRRMGC